MTEQAPEIPGAYPPVIVIPKGESRLAQLHAAYADAKAKADAAAAALKVITDGIKRELQESNPGGQRFELRSPNGPALSLVQTKSWRFDSKKLKATDPQTYVQYAYQTEAWTLRALSGGGDE